MFAMQRSSLKSLPAALAAALTLVSGMSARAAIDVSQSPLFLPSTVDPNILLCWMIRGRCFGSRFG